MVDKMGGFGLFGVVFKGRLSKVFRQNDVCTEHYLCTNIASVAYRLFDGFVSVAISMAYGNI
jgi:hypothetical protein